MLLQQKRGDLKFIITRIKHILEHGAIESLFLFLILLIIEILIIIWIIAVILIGWIIIWLWSLANLCPLALLRLFLQVPWDKIWEHQPYSIIIHALEKILGFQNILIPIAIIDISSEDNFPLLLWSGINVEHGGHLFQL